jgi:hypothetical protein
MSPKVTRAALEIASLFEGLHKGVFGTLAKAALACVLCEEKLENQF